MRIEPGRIVPPRTVEPGPSRWPWPSQEVDAVKTRKHVHEEVFPASAERLFALLHTPSAIRAWWGAARAIVIPRTGGAWLAAWGPDEDDPDYVAGATLQVFEPPSRLVMAYQPYYARSGPLPFEADFVTEFTVRPHPEGAVLRVEQDGFPCEPVADAHFTACERGWIDTFRGIRRYLEGQDAPERPQGKIEWQDLTVEDATRVRDFYCATAGWTSEEFDMGGYPDYVMKTAASGEAVAGICHARGVNAGLPPQWLLYVTVPDLDHSIRECARLGGKIVSGPKDGGPHGRSCVIQDPAGAYLTLMQPAA